MTNKLSMLLKKYSIPVVFFIVGLIMLIIGFKNNQGSTFMISAVMMFIAGGLSVLYSSGKLKPMVVYAIGILAGIAGIVTIYISGKSVYDTTEYMRNYEKCKAIAKQNLEDIRYIQKAYADQHGHYLANWEELIDYTYNGTIPYVEAQGVVPNRKIIIEERKYLYNDNRPIDNNMTEEEAYRLSKWTEGPNWATDFANFKRDTIDVSILKTKFQSRSYVESRNKQGFYTFSPDSLPYIPYTKGKEKWTMIVQDSVKVLDAYLPTIRVEGMIPYADQQGKNGNKEEMYFGSKTNDNTSGSWEE